MRSLPGRSIFFALTISASVLLLGQGVCRAETIVAPAGPRAQSLPPAPKTLGDLIEGARQYDGSRAVLEGEVVGDIMRRGGIGWLNISDGTATIGVWGPVALLREVNLAGDYKTRGDRLRVQGIFYRADPRQGGELDIRASSLAVIARGARMNRPVTAARILLAAIAVGLAALLGLVWSRLRPGREIGENGQDPR